jgi:hypothetical protein
MMQGRERTLLEQAIWDDTETVGSRRNWEGYEVELQAGDGLFIPKGWWHSIKGVGESVTASVSQSYQYYEALSFANIFRSIGGFASSSRLFIVHHGLGSRSIQYQHHQNLNFLIQRLQVHISK